MESVTPVRRSVVSRLWQTASRLFGVWLGRGGVLKGAHPAIPNIEEGSEIPAHVGVMGIVVGDGVEPSIERMAGDEPWDNFIPRMPSRVHLRVHPEENQERYRVERQKHDEPGNSKELNDRLARLKCKNGPGRRTDRSVMANMQVFEYWPPVHEAMRPVKVGVVNYHAQKNTYRQIKPSVFPDTPINTGPARLVELKQNGGHHREDKHAKDGELDFAHDSGACRAAMLNATLLLRIRSPEMVQPVIAPGRR